MSKQRVNGVANIICERVLSVFWEWLLKCCWLSVTESRVLVSMNFDFRALKLWSIKSYSGWYSESYEVWISTITIFWGLGTHVIIVSGSEVFWRWRGRKLLRLEVLFWESWLVQYIGWFCDYVVNCDFCDLIDSRRILTSLWVSRWPSCKTCVRLYTKKKNRKD